MESNVLCDLVVVKRSGQRVPFNGAKIAIAIKKAFDSVYDDYDEENVNKIYNSVLKYIKDNYCERKTINVEVIQDIIENTLQKENYNDIYNSFNSYRLKRKAYREIFERRQQHKFVRATEKLILTIQDESNTPLEMILNFGKTISDEFSKAYLIDSKYVRSHDEGSLFIHDLNYYVFGMTSSSHLDFSNIIDYDNFFNIIADLLLNFKKEQYGEHSFTSIDYILEPWLIYEFKNIYKKNINNFIEVEGLSKYINMNPIENIIDKITSIYISINIFSKYIYSPRIRLIFENAYSISLSELKDRVYLNIKNLLNTLDNCEFKINNKYGYSISLGTNGSKEGQFISDIYFDVLSNMDRLDNVATIYKIGNIRNNILIETIVKLLLDNKNIAFSNITASYNKKYLIDSDYKTEVEYFSNGERILENILEKNQASIGRILINKFSINLVRLALKNKNIKDFYKELDEILELTKNGLLQSFEYISNKYKENYKYLFKDNVLFDSEKLENNQKIRKIIKNGTLNIGYVGLKECIYILTNKNDENITIEDMKIGIDILKFMKERCDKFSSENKLNFVLFETYDKEVLEYLEAIDKSIYGGIKYEYTPFYKIFNKFKIDLSERLKLESKLQKYSNGGYYEIINIPKNYSNKKMLEIISLVKEYDIGFFKIKVGKLE